MKYRLAAIPKTAVIVVLGILISGGKLSGVDCLVVTLGCLLWAALYALNEAIDLLIEEKESGSRRVVPLCLIICVICVLGGGLAGGIRIGILFALMTLSQLIYCWPGLRTKRFVWAGPLQSGLINPALRFSVGVSLGFGPATNAVTVSSCYALLIALHLAGALKTRVYQTPRDRQLGYRTIPVAFVRRYIEPLQFVTPVCVGGFVFLALGRQGMFFLPAIACAIAILLVMIGVFAIWAINDIYDRARHKLVNLLLLNYGGDLAQAELTAGDAIAGLEAEVGTPSIDLLRNLWHFKMPIDLIIPGRLTLAAALSLSLYALPATLSPITAVVALLVYRAMTRPEY